MREFREMEMYCGAVYSERSQQAPLSLSHVVSLSSALLLVYEIEYFGLLIRKRRKEITQAP